MCVCVCVCVCVLCVFFLNSKTTFLSIMRARNPCGHISPSPYSCSKNLKPPNPLILQGALKTNDGNNVS